MDLTGVSRFHKLLYYWLPVFIYCLLIFIQSSFPTPEQIPDWSYLDKLLHFFAYAVLGALFMRAFDALHRKEKLNQIMLLSILCSSLYGISDELHQYFIPFRHADLFDAFADVVGSVWGVYIYRSFIIKT